MSTQKETAIDTLARIWPEFDPDGLGILAPTMERVLLRVEQEQGTSLMEQASWDRLEFYMERVGETVVSQKDLADLLSLLQDPFLLAGDATQHQEHPEQQQQEQEEQQINPSYTHPLEANSFQELSDTNDHSVTDTSLLQSEPEPAYSESHLHPRHSSAISQRPRASIRKISLSESTQFRPRHHRVTHGSSPEASDVEEDRRSSRQDNDAQLESLQQAYFSMQKKLRDQDVEYEARVNEQVKKNISNQQQMEDLNRDLKTMRREIQELKTTERHKTSQIADLEKQMEKTERTNSSQKTSAAAMKRQKDELEDENGRMQEVLRQKEEALNQATLRLTAIEAETRKINADQETMETLRERLVAEITKNEEMATQMELLSSKLRQTEELTGGQRSEFDVTSIGQINASLDEIGLQGRTLMSELASVDAKFGPGYDQADVSLDTSKRPSSDATAKWDPAHEGARRLLRESTSFGMKMKRSSIRDLNQRFKETSVESSPTQDRKEPPSPYTPTASSANLGEEISASAVVVKSRADDDVDCALPLGLQALEVKETLLDQELGTQAELIEELFKTKEPSHPLEVTFGNESILGQTLGMPSLKLKADRARRRKAHPSRVLTQSEVVNLLNPGANQGSSATSPPGVRSGVPRTRALNKRENKNVIANVTLVSMYTIVVYLFGVITSVFLVDNGQVPGGFNYGRFLSFDALQEVANNDMNGGPGRFKVVEILVYWLQNLVWQGDAGYVPT
ncbi:hypothetical protein BGX29_010181 [Mortierella sp. GBA35]|nr:hypothetical protein BGX29_010181 [Mortierella sp. GBA35]